MGWIKIIDLDSGKVLKTYGTVETKHEVCVNTWTDPETKEPRSEVSFFNQPIELSNESSQDRSMLKDK